MRTLFTSDLHFFHKNISDLSGRPWKSEDNTEKVIELWNNEVNPEDEVWNLGDMFFAHGSAKQVEWCVEVLLRLHGTMHLIKGNHDPSKLWDKIFERLNHPSWITFDKMKEIKVGGKKVVMCHYPMVNWNQSNRGAIQLHGHCHGSFHNKGKSIDVGLDGAEERLGEWRFWTEEDVLRYAKGLEINNVDHHQ